MSRDLRKTGKLQLDPISPSSQCAPDGDLNARISQSAHRHLVCSWVCARARLKRLIKNGQTLSPTVRDEIWLDVDLSFGVIMRVVGDVKEAVDVPNLTS